MSLFAECNSPGTWMAIDLTDQIGPLHSECTQIQSKSHVQAPSQSSLMHDNVPGIKLQCNELVVVSGIE